MSAYAEFKKCLIDAWPGGRQYFCAQMIMLDYGLRIEGNTKAESSALIESFLRSIKMPFHLSTSVSVYIGAFYPKTSAALFAGVDKSVALRMFMRERHRIPNSKLSSAYIKRLLMKQDMREHPNLFVRARELDKKHDWKTVK